MKLIRFGEPGEDKLGLEFSEGIRIDVSTFGEDYDEKFFASKGIECLEKWVGNNKET